ncbi:unnamed protein product [Effrenium voratum]|uniref:Uncharacterized protein n=1 Tax=Effrenium voratum TaxID=2562239 RepID=A0AA36JMJ5_9DINO|nr:unnamed protein product [Effrenium voratum]
MWCEQLQLTASNLSAEKDMKLQVVESAASRGDSDSVAELPILHRPLRPPLAVRWRSPLPMQRCLSLRRSPSRMDRTAQDRELLQHHAGRDCCSWGEVTCSPCAAARRVPGSDTAK